MKLAEVNTSDIRDAIVLGCGTMSRVFNADDNDIPFFASSVHPVAGLGFNPVHSEAHVPGRHLNALLNAEAALSILIEEAAIEKHAKAAFFSYSGLVALPLNREVLGGPLVNFAPHNIREGFHALYPLVKYRQSARARELAEASIAAIFDLWKPDAGWNRARLEGEWKLRIIDFDAPFIGGVARAIGPLVKYFEATRYAPALQLATLLKDKVVGEYFLEGGEYDISLGTHTHSVTCVMSSLAQLAQTTRDAPLMERVRRFYDNGLRKVSNELGWSLENASPHANPDRGEANNTGDILETALILGRWGYTDYYHHAERILRGHLLPSQLRDIAFIRMPENPKNEDGKRDVARRHVGAFGFPAPYGHLPIGMGDISFNMDIVGGAVASLCEAWRAIAHSDARGHFVNLLFDRSIEGFSTVSPYTQRGAHQAMTIEIKKSAPLWVRIPPWVERDDIEVTGALAWPQLVNGYLLIPHAPQGNISIYFPLVQRNIVLTHRARRIRARLEGDRVLAMENFGADLTFFDSIP